MNRILQIIKNRKQPAKLHKQGNLEWYIEDIKDYSQQRKALWRVISENTGNPLLRQYASEIIKKYNIPERDDKAFINGIVKYVQDNIKFFRELPETFASPIRTIEWGLGDCDDKSILIATLLRSFRFPIRLKLIRFTTKGVKQGHVYPQVWTANKWLSLESVHKWHPGRDAEQELTSKGIKVNIEYIGDEPTKFNNGETMAGMDDEYDYENPNNTFIDNEDVIDTDSEEMGIENHTPIEDSPQTETLVIDEQEETPIKKARMPASFKKQFPGVSRMYLEMQDGRKILFEV